ncbi:hypothetical protein PVAND_017316 [Polypedilum vanderplanki]|uniref:Single Kunitz protease inhibitor n=1 Tax=Polypedilum vanderplanki TaxID=319348 RepID=A0A9J6BHX9_POLVA|nr:hypothetical protein PVAND_017316 [Polypedilum vanderplanki]
MKVFPLSLIVAAFFVIFVSAEDRCLLEKQHGHCRAHMKKFYFNKDIKFCQEFLYGGCDGNENNFDSMEACLAACAHHINFLNIFKNMPILIPG